MAVSVENLFALDDAGVRALNLPSFVAQLKASPSVLPVFFDGAEMPVPPLDAVFLDDLAVALVCSSIAHCTLHAFGESVVREKCDEYWRSRLDSQQAVKESQHLYAWAFPQHCQASGHTFAEYLYGEPERWASELARHVTAPMFLDEHRRSLAAEESDGTRRLNLVLYKLSRLDRTRIGDVVDVWRQAFREFEMLEDWRRWNFLPVDAFSEDLFLAEVTVAISAATNAGRRRSGRHVWHDAFLHGAGVADFLRSDKPRALGLTSGKEPKNTTSKMGDSSAYFVEGTPVHLAGGGVRSIEKLRADDEVLALQGESGRHSGEQVVARIDQESPVFGINDLPPFFSAGHAFLTKDGWKAVEPAAAHADNPRRRVGQLQVGDILMRVHKDDPTMYDEVEIRRISTRSIPAGSKLYGLHLTDAQSYHVHGFCVAMHYPVIKENHLAEGFSQVSEAERRMIATRMRSVMPLISHALGRSVAQPILRSLGVASPTSDGAALQRTTRNFTLHLAESVGKPFLEFGEPRQLRLANGKVEIDGRVLEKPEFRRGALTWSQTTSQGYSAGCLHFTPDRLAFQGVLYQGRTVQTAYRSYVQGTPPPSVYQTTVGRTAGQNPKDTEPGVSVTLGYRYVPDKPPQLILEFNGEPSAVSVASLQINEQNGNLQLVINYDAAITPAACQTVSPLWPASGLIEFSWDGSSFTGTMAKYDAATSQATKEQFLWTGKTQ